jgi:sugar lactone lactonase YvrE
MQLRRAFQKFPMQRINTVLVLTLVTLFCQCVFAVEFVGTNISSGQLLVVTPPSGSVAITTTGAQPDGVIFGPNQQIFYALSGAGTVHIFNPFTRTDTIMASGFTTPAELTMEPACKSILVSDIGVNKIFRIAMNTHVVTTLYNGPDKMQGLTYDNGGNLYAVDDQLNAIVQIDTTTGAIVNQTPSASPMTALEGLAYDNYTQQLFATSNSGQELYEVPTTLSTVTSIPFTTEPTLHGIVSDNQGNLYVVGANGTTSFLLQYSIITGTEKTMNNVPGLQNIAPIISGPCPKGSSGVLAEACGGN